ncbi:MAG: ParB N-terminal domain-containing protein [bacterium]
MKFKEYYLKEIGDRVIEPKLVELKIRYTSNKTPVFNYTFTLNINDKSRIYYVTIDPFEFSDFPEVAPMIDFGTFDMDNLIFDISLTGDNEPFIIMSNVVGIVKRFITKDLFDSIKDTTFSFKDVRDKLFLSSLNFEAIKEFVKDDRRKKLYDKVIKRQLRDLNITIKSIDVMKIEGQEFNSYKIEPIKIKDIKSSYIKEETIPSDHWFKYASPDDIISLVKKNHDILPLEKFEYEVGYKPDDYLKTYKVSSLTGFFGEKRKWHIYQGEQYFGNYPIKDWYNFLSDIAKNGLKEPILLSSDGSEIIEGNHRVQALKQLGYKLIPVRYE